MSEQPLFSHDAETRRLFAERFDRHAFRFRHGLAQHPRFSLAALRDLAAGVAAEKGTGGFFILSNAHKDADWGSPEFQRLLTAAFDDIEASRMRMKLSNIQRRPEWQEFFAACRTELSELAGVDFGREYPIGMATLFISSPGELTPYHIDEEANFLVQIYGTKTFYSLDINESSVDWRYLEDYYTGKGPPPLPDFERRGVAFELTPGYAVHNPKSFPHWVKNGPTPSVSLALGFVPAVNPADVLRFNGQLRRVGLTPRPPGDSATVDRAKYQVYKSYRNLKSGLQQRAS